MILTEFNISLRRPPPDVYLPSLLSCFVLLYLSVCEALKLRPLPFTHPVYV